VKLVEVKMYEAGTGALVSARIAMGYAQPLKCQMRGMTLGLIYMQYNKIDKADQKSPLFCYF